MVKGSCMCGQATYEYTGEYSAFIACHCIPCRKTSGADRSMNLVIPSSSITVSPTTQEKLTSRKADSGGDLVYHHCANCGGIMFSEPKNAPEVLFLKIGLLDDKEFLDGLGTPQMDIYCKNSWSWEKPIEGAKVAQAGP
ncbi:unnamed protein product [Discula destructiva]